MTDIDKIIADYRMRQLARRLARRTLLRCLICLDLSLSVVAVLGAMLIS